MTRKVIMPGELISIGVGKGIGEIADEARDIYGLDKRSDAVKRIMRDWKWGRQKGSKSEKMDQILRNQQVLLMIEMGKFLEDGGCYPTDLKVAIQKTRDMVPLDEEGF